VASCGGTSSPLSPLRTTLGVPPVSVATSGSPAAFASHSTRPIVSTSRTVPPA
jgi:hypothetical protein